MGYYSRQTRSGARLFRTAAAAVSFRGILLATWNSADRASGSAEAICWQLVFVTYEALYKFDINWVHLNLESIEIASLSDNQCLIKSPHKSR